MPPRKRSSSVLNGAADDLLGEADRVTSADDALAAAEEADAEAAAADAVAAAARARARAIRLRREAAQAQADERSREEHDVEPTAVGESATPELEQPSTSATDAAETAAPSKSLIVEPSEDEDTREEMGAVSDEDDFADADGAEDDLDLPAKQPSRALWKMIAKALVVTVALVGSIALLGLSGAMYWHHRNVEAQRAQSAEFAAAARQGAITLMSLDFNKAKDDVQRIIDNTTGEFKKDFQGQADAFINTAQASKVVTEANVNAVAVQSMTKDEATVLVAVTTNVSNAASKEQQPRSWRLRVGVARDGDQIKLSKVEFVP